MGYFLRKLAAKAAEKVMKVDPTDALTQSSVDDILNIVKELFL